MNKELAAMVSSLRISTKALLDSWDGISVFYDEDFVKEQFGPKNKRLGATFDPSWIDMITAMSKETVSATFNIWHDHAVQLQELLTQWIPAGWELYKDELLSPARKEVVDALLNNERYGDLVPVSEMLLGGVKCLKSINTDGGEPIIAPSILESMRSSCLLAVETTTITWALFHLTQFIPQMNAIDERKTKTAEVTAAVEKSGHTLGKTLTDRANLLKDGRLPLVSGSAPELPGGDAAGGDVGVSRKRPRRAR